MMRLVSLFVLLSLLGTLLSSCYEEPSAYEKLTEFVRAYGAEGVIYSPFIPEGSDGHLPPLLVEKIYRFSGNLPDNFAVLLNPRTDMFFECGVFVCDGADGLSSVTETCRERVKLLCGGDARGFSRISEMTVFYSTLSDRARAERIWREIISKK